MNKKVIDKNALFFNVDYLKKKSNAKFFCAVVKANAYGHGAKQIVKLLNDRVDYFAVASFKEAINIRKSSCKPILVLSPQIKPKIEAHIELCVENLQDVVKIDKLQKEVFVHLKINSGMSRFGCKLYNARKIIKFIEVSKYIKLKGIFTHYYNVKNWQATQKQKDKFIDILKHLDLPANVIIHASNTQGAISGMGFDMCRCGIGIYGFGDKLLKPIMKIYSQIVSFKTIKAGECLGYDAKFIAKKQTKIAVVGIGYADGFERSFSFGFVKIKNHFCKILGNVCMDCLFCDVSCVNCEVGDRVLVLGEDIRADDIAKKIKKIPYEIVCDLNNLR